MALYIDGYLLPIPEKQIAAYRRLARAAGRIWREHGALEYRECVGDDMDIKGVVNFPRSLKAKEGETVIFAWIVYRSRAHRDRVNAKVMTDPRITAMSKLATPFDLKRMLYGGFRVIVDL